MVSDKSNFKRFFQKDSMWYLSCDISYLEVSIDTKTFFYFVRNHTMIIPVQFGFNLVSERHIRSYVNIMSCSGSHWFQVNTNIERVHKMIILVYCMGSIKFLISEKNIFFIFPYLKTMFYNVFLINPKKITFYIRPSKAYSSHTCFLEDH